MSSYAKKVLRDVYSEQLLSNLFIFVPCYEIL